MLQVCLQEINRACELIMSLSRERLKQLEEIEQDVVRVIEAASQSLLEISKAQPSEEYIIKTTTEFLKGTPRVCFMII